MECGSTGRQIQIPHADKPPVKHGADFIQMVPEIFLPAKKRPIIMKLGQAGIKSLEDLADLSSDELIEILGEDTMSQRLAGRVVMKARELAYGITEE